MKTITKLGLAIMLFMTTAISNHAQAQTKEETIAWIKEKLENSTSFYNSSWSNMKIKSITECAITYTFKYYGNHEQTLPVKNATFDSEGRLKYSANVIIDIDKDLTEGGQSFKQYSDIRIIESEVNLRERFLKALNHLATFCVEKKQTF